MSSSTINRASMQNNNPIRNTHHKVPHVVSVCCTGGILEGRIALRFAFEVELLKKNKNILN